MNNVHHGLFPAAWPSAWGRSGKNNGICSSWFFQSSANQGNYLIIICNYLDYLKPWKLFDYFLPIIWWLFVIIWCKLVLIIWWLFVVIWIISNYLIVIWFWLFEQQKYSHYLIQQLLSYLKFIFIIWHWLFVLIIIILDYLKLIMSIYV